MTNFDWQGAAAETIKQFARNQDCYVMVVDRECPRSPDYGFYLCLRFNGKSWPLECCLRSERIPNHCSQELETINQWLAQGEISIALGEDELQLTRNLPAFILEPDIFENWQDYPVRPIAIHDYGFGSAIQEFVPLGTFLPGVAIKEIQAKALNGTEVAPRD